jgi:hypothetical protein
MEQERKHCERSVTGSFGGKIAEKVLIGAMKS